MFVKSKGEGVFCSILSASGLMFVLFMTGLADQPFKASIRQLLDFRGSLLLFALIGLVLGARVSHFRSSDKKFLSILWYLSLTGCIIVKGSYSPVPVEFLGLFALMFSSEVSVLIADIMVPLKVRGLGVFFARLMISSFVQVFLGMPIVKCCYSSASFEDGMVLIVIFCIYVVCSPIEVCLILFGGKLHEKGHCACGES